jgi:nitronate monooxygenase
LNFPTLSIGHLKPKFPIIQGGMGIGISMHRLAGAVAAAGGIGVISGANPGFKEPDFLTNPFSANLVGLAKEIRLAKAFAPEGFFGVNILCATSQYADLVKTAVAEKIDLIISGAGLPKNLPELVSGSDTKIAPIVSSRKTVDTLLKLWDKRYQRTADAIVVEGPLAGGHLGFSKEDLLNNPPNLIDLVKEVLDAVKPFEEKYGIEIPVIAAGGIYTPEDAAIYYELGAKGVQMATRFIGTVECDAADSYKQAFIDANEGDVQLVVSPVGLPGRAIRSALTQKLELGRVPVTRCIGCLGHCDPATTPYCITGALVEAVNGNIEDGLIFSGANGYKIKEITTVGAIFDEFKLYFNVV